MNSTYSGGGAKYAVQHNFKVLGDGKILMNSSVRPSNKGTILPRMGFRTELTPYMEQLNWFGRGPWDSYVDRKEACFPGVYTSTVTDQYTGYIKPQEHGTKQEVRWVSLTNKDGKGLMIVAPDQMAMSATHFRVEDNYTNRNSRAKHTYEFKSVKNTILCLDMATRGLGNASCGPDLLTEYDLYSKDVELSAIIMPLTDSLTIRKMSKMARVSMPVCKVVTAERNNSGNIVLSCGTKSSTIHYSLDGGETYKKYTSPFALNNGGTVTCYATLDGCFDGAVQTYEFGMYINKSAWKVVSYDSQHSGNEASKAIDGNTGTFWHTEYSGKEPECPHEIVVDMAKAYLVTAISYTARNDGTSNGMVGQYEFYLSNDAAKWGAPVATGTFKNATGPQTVTLSNPVEGRYLKMIAKSEVNGKAWSSCAELDIEAKEVVSPMTTSTSSKINSGGVYFLRDVQSGLYLHLNKSSNQYELAELDASDATFSFKTTLVSGYKSYYTLMTSSKYMTKSGDNAFDIVAGSNTSNKDSWIQIEQFDDHDVCLRGVWQTSEYINLDKHIAGAKIYSNKSTGNTFQLLTKQQATALQKVEAQATSFVVYNAQGMRMESRDASQSIDLKGYRKGVYVVKSLDSTGKVVLTRKMIVK